MLYAYGYTNKKGTSPKFLGTWSIDYKGINNIFFEFGIDEDKYFENVVIPKKWRFLDSLPTDIQGKKHKLEIQKLFS